ncbi:MAG: exodeoxyribonuclease VII small subunit [Clostridia bacterium]|nr:exodeoxyribonuclease VII small subunit [Clostridia bacterium]
MKKKSFEEAISELENVVNELESSDLSLDESVKKFQTGMELSQYCNQLLEEAEKRITVLIENCDGEMKEENFKLDQEEKLADGDNME